jgi:hypothetical protein
MAYTSWIWNGDSVGSIRQRGDMVLKIVWGETEVRDKASG